MPVRRFDADFQKHQDKLSATLLVDDGFAAIYDIFDRQPQIKSSASSLEDLAAEELARNQMIQRLRRGKHSQMAELSESEAREKYLERLTSRKSK